MAVDTTELDAAFNKWLRERRTDLSLRQQFWLAFDAGARHVLSKINAATTARAAAETNATQQKFERPCSRCGDPVYSSEPLTAAVVYCGLKCAD